MSDSYSTIFDVMPETADGVSGRLLLEQVARDVLTGSGVPDGAMQYRGSWTTEAGPITVDGDILDSSTVRWKLQAKSRARLGEVTTDVRLATTGEAVEVHITSRASRSGSTGRGQLPGRPDIVPVLIAGYRTAQFGEDLDLNPTAYTADNLAAFTFTIVNPDRVVPWVLLTHRNSGGPPLLDPLHLADQLAGLANVAVLSDKFASMRLSDEIGKLFSCYDGGARLYWPGCNPAYDDPYRHPLFMPWDIEANPVQAQSDIFNRLCREALQSLPSSGPTWIATTARARKPGAPKPERANSATPPVAAHSPEIAVDDISARLMRLWGREEPPGQVTEPQPEAPADEPETDGEPKISDTPAGLEESDARPPEIKLSLAISRLHEDRDELLELIASQEQRIQLLEARLEDVVGRLDAVYAPEAGMSDSYNFRSVLEAVEEAAESFSRIHFLPSANRSAKRSRYRDPARVFKAFEVMDRIAQERLTGESLGQRLEGRFEEFGFDYAPHLSSTTGTKFESEYTFQYGSTGVVMESHLKLGTDFDPSKCLRIHFAWDLEKKRWLVGHVGLHLRNTRT